MSNPLVSLKEVIDVLFSPRMNVATMVTSLAVFVATLLPIKDIQSLPFIGGTRFAAPFFFLFALVLWIEGQWKTHKSEQQDIRDREVSIARHIRYLSGLTRGEKEVLRAFVEAGERVVHFDVNDPSVQSLDCEGFFTLAGGLTVMPQQSFRLVDHVWVHIHAHPDLIAEE